MTDMSPLSHNVRVYLISHLEESHYVLPIYFILLLLLFQTLIYEVTELLHYEEPSSVNPQKRVNFDSKMGDYFE